MPFNILYALDFHNGILEKVSDLPRKAFLGLVEKAVEYFCSLCLSLKVAPSPPQTLDL